MSFTREWFLGVANDWQFAAAYTVCAILGAMALGNKLLKASHVWSIAPRYCGEQTNVYPPYVSYNGVMYIRGSEADMGVCTMEYISYYAAIVVVMGALEKMVEGSIGILVRLEVWGIVGALIGRLVFSFTGTIAGMFIGFGIMISREGASIATYLMTWGRIGGALGAFGGALFGMAMAVKHAADSYEVGFWTAVCASLVPVFIIFVEVSVRMSVHREMVEHEDAINKQYEGISFIPASPDRECSKYEPPLPPVVRSCTKEEYWKIREKKSVLEGRQE